MVSRRSITRRKRYAEDPEYREKELASKRASHAAHKDERNARNRARYAAHKDEINARMRARRRSDPEFREKERADQRRRRYGISDPDYEALLARQGGVCAICGRKSRRRLVVDHCHVCDRVRGLLCHNCNLGLGYYCDDAGRLQAAIAYLQRSRREPAPSPGPGGCSCDLHISPGTAPLADPSRTIPSTAREPCAAVGNCNELVHQQKGDRMTPDENVILAGAQAPAQPLPIIPAAPPLAPAAPFEATLVAGEGRAVWTVRPIEDVERMRVATLLAEGMSIRDIAEETGISKSTVQRIKRKLERDTSNHPGGTAKVEQEQ